jgi:hypothetical protein
LQETVYMSVKKPQLAEVPAGQAPD